MMNVDTTELRNLKHRFHSTRNTVFFYYTRAVPIVTFVYFGQLMDEQGIASAVASRESLPCKPLHNWSPSVYSWVCRVSYDVSCD
jgi:hypothetical protein